MAKIISMFRRPARPQPACFSFPIEIDPVAYMPRSRREPPPIDPLDWFCSLPASKRHYALRLMRAGYAMAA